MSKQKRKFKRGDVRLTFIGHTTIGIILAILISILSTIFWILLATNSSGVAEWLAWTFSIVQLVYDGILLVFIINVVIEATEFSPTTLPQWDALTGHWLTTAAILTSLPTVYVIMGILDLKDAMFEEVK